MAASPSSSPRLPSPPPMAEDQLGPKSPTIAGYLDHGMGANIFHDGASRRIRPGTKAADMPEGPPLVPLKDIDTAFQLTEHLKALYNNAIHPRGSLTVVPIDRQTATRLAQPPEGVDKYLWLYELCRFLCQEVNKMIVALFAGDPPCSAQTCNEMRASEWQYLCAVHDPPKPCCAIDYCCHTLDWAANVLTSPKNFPSRLALQTETGSGHQQLRQLTNIFRRVYRIFAHAWFQHRDMFWKVESKSGIYVFFKTVCDVYGLIPEDNYTVPPEAEGIESPPVVTRQAPTLLKRGEEESKKIDSQNQELLPNAAISVSTTTGHTTKRHRQTPSVDAGLITTVPEEAEEAEEDDNRNAERQVSVSKSSNEEVKFEPATAEEEKTEEPAAEEEPEHKPEDVKAEVEVPAHTKTEEAAELFISELAEPTAAIESSEPHHATPSVLPSVLTSESQSTPAASQKDKDSQEEKKQASEIHEEKEQASEVHEEKEQASEAYEEKLGISKTSEPSAVESETSETKVESAEIETLAEEETNKSTKIGPQEPVETPFVKEEVQKEPVAAVESKKEPKEKKTEEKTSSTSTPALEEEKDAEVVSSDPKADAKDAEEATKSVED